MFYLLLAAALVVADQLFKLWVKGAIPLGGARPFIPGFLGLTHLHNTGMAFSMLSEHTWLLGLVSVAAAALLIWLIFKWKIPRAEKVMISIVLGGAVGNAIDRIFQGFVVDMFEFQFINFAVFNLADVFIDVGAVLFCVLYFTRSFKEEREMKLPDTPEDTDDGADNGN